MPEHTRQVVLVIDDEPDVMATITDILRKQGFAVVLPPENWTAEAIARMPFDLLLTDLMMPGIDGVEVIRAVRQRRPDAPIIAFSGFLHLPQYAVDKVIGADLVLKKPLAAALLAQAIADTIREKRDAAG